MDFRSVSDDVMDVFVTCARSAIRSSMFFQTDADADKLGGNAGFRLRYKNNHIYIDCKKEDEIREFCSKTANAEKIIEYISLRKGKQINEKTLLIFDEVQECPNIISSLKYFCQDFREIPFPCRKNQSDNNISNDL